MSKKKRRIFKTLFTLFFITILLAGALSLFKNKTTDIEKLNAEFINNSPYVLEVEVKQNHLSFSLGKYVKDAINTFDFKIPVSKNYFDSVKEGSVLADDFRFGSLLTEGSVGSWKISVKNKLTQNLDTTDTDSNSSNSIALSIRQTHVSFNLGKHIKDNMNEILINIDVNDDYYNSVKNGDVIIKKFRWGSLFSDGSIGYWEVAVKK